MSTHRLTRFVAVAGVALAVLTGVLSGGPDAWARQPQLSQTAAPDPCIAGEPCFTNVSDILNGRRHLLRTDDLAFAGLFEEDVEDINGAGAVLQTSNSSTITSTTPTSFTFIGQSEDNIPTIANARMFDLDHDVVVSAVFGEGILEIAGLIPDPLSFSGGTGRNSFLLSATADFTGDGYDDLVFSKGGLLQVVTAVDPTAPSEGVRFGSELNSNVNSNVVFPHQALAVGNFPNGAQVVTLGPIEGGRGLAIEFFSVDPASLGLISRGFLDLTLRELGASPTGSELAAGRFSTTLHDQLVLTYSVDPTQNVQVTTVDFDAQGNPVQKAAADLGFTLGEDGGVFLRSGRFDWGSPFDQAVHYAQFANPGSATVSSFRMLTFDANLNPTVGQQTPFTGAGQFCRFGEIAVGNFDRMRSNPTPPPATERDPNLQVAYIGTDCGPNVYVNIFSVDPDQNFKVTQVTSDPGIRIPSEFIPAVPVPVNHSLSLAAADTQGRSLALGAPTKVVIEHRSQASVVVAAPPMHVDYVTPVGASAPEVFNLSAIPGSFFTRYQTDESNQDQSSAKSSTSWSAGAKETAEGKLTVGIPDVDAVTVDDKFSAQQTWKGSVENVHGTTSSQTFDVSQQTGFGDQVWYDSSRMNLYIYPVIGKTVCPAAQPDCADKVPLTVQFSGPDVIHHETVPGASLEWYQPPWEPGNVLSYPATEAQLGDFTTELDKLSQDLSWLTDQTVLTEKTAWNTGTTDSQSSSFDQNYSFDNTTTVSAVGSTPFDSGSLSASLDLSGSFGFSKLHTSVTTLGKSTGIGVQKPGSFANPGLYQYAVTPVIYGQQRPGGVVNDLPLSTDVQTFGILKTAFVVDPTDPSTGSWWSQAYPEPDVALNHPVRWGISAAALTDPVPPNCRPKGGSEMNCAALNLNSPSNPWQSEFHWMRGLFITNVEAGPQGAQIETATAGDKLLLQARVYNYSLTEMAPGTTVHVRFYGQPWDNTNNTPEGNSFLIEEVVTGTIPASNADSTAPNWMLVPITTSFDTMPYADQYLTFWVVVWTEDASGKLVGEMPGHGLTGIPGSLSSLVDAAPISEPYSNNVGFWKYAFYVFPAPTTVAAVAMRSPPPNKGPVVDMRRVRLSSHGVARGQPITVSTKLHTGGQDVKGGLTVLFYDGDPAQGGKAFDLERVVHLRAGDTHDVRVPFRSSQCGKHRIFVVAGKRTAFQQTKRSRAIKVRCPKQRDKDHDDDRDDRDDVAAR